MGGTGALAPVSAEEPTRVGLVAPEEPYRPTPPPYEAPPNTWAWVSLVSGGVCLATGIGFGVAAVVEHRNARDIDQRLDDEDARAEEQAQYEAAIDTRDDLRIVSGIAGGTGLGLFLLAGVLFAREDIRRDAEKKEAVAGDVAATPWVGPGIAGGSATVSF